MTTWNGNAEMNWQLVVFGLLSHHWSISNQSRSPVTSASEIALSSVRVRNSYAVLLPTFAYILLTALCLGLDSSNPESRTEAKGTFLKCHLHV